MNRIAIFFAIFLVSVSVVPALAGPPVDTGTSEVPLVGDAPEAEAGAGTTGNDSQTPDEPLPEPTVAGEDPSGLDADAAAPDVSPDINEAADTPSPEGDDTTAGISTPDGNVTVVPTDEPDPGLNVSEEDGTPESPAAGLPAVENDTATPQPEETPVLEEDVTDEGTPIAGPEPEETATPTPQPEGTPVADPTPTVIVDPTPTVTAGPGSGNVSPDNTTTPEETTPIPTNTTDLSPAVNPTASPGVVENESGSSGSLPDNTTTHEETTPIPTNTTDLSPAADPTLSPGVENESESSDSLPDNGTAGEVLSRAAVLCIWEQLDPAGDRLDDDPVQPGSQFLPPCAYGATKTVEIRAVVAGGGATPYPVVADVTSPDGSPFSRVNLTRQDSAVGALEAASMAGLVTYAHATSLNEGVRALEDSRAAVYVGEVDLSFSQTAGDYDVSVRVLPEGVDPAVDQPLASVFTYLPTASFEIDFAAVNYGIVEPESDTWVEGDADFGTAQRPTVRNTGNVPICISVSQDDMGLDVSVAYLAKLGNGGTPVAFGPMEEVTLPGVLPVNETAPLSLALRVSSGEGTPNGRLWVSCFPATGED